MTGKNESKTLTKDISCEYKCKSDGRKCNSNQILFNEKNITRKTQNVYILFAFLLITISLLITVNIYCYLIKHRARQKHLLPFHVTNNELREILY